jgi:hypothetical protein
LKKSFKHIDKRIKSDMIISVPLKGMKSKEVKMVIFIERWENPNNGNEEIKKKFNYDRVGPFMDGLAKARKNGQCFHVLPDGTPAYPERYEEAEDFQSGFASVKKNGKWSHIKKDGTLAHGKWYEWVLDFKDPDGRGEELLAMVREEDLGRKKGETYEIRPDGTRFYPKNAPTAQ